MSHSVINLRILKAEHAAARRLLSPAELTRFQKTIQTADYDHLIGIQGDVVSSITAGIDLYQRPAKQKSEEEVLREVVHSHDHLRSLFGTLLAVAEKLCVRHYHEASKSAFDLVTELAFTQEPSGAHTEKMPGLTTIVASQLIPGCIKSEGSRNIFLNDHYINGLVSLARKNQGIGGSMEASSREASRLSFYLMKMPENSRAKSELINHFNTAMNRLPEKARELLCSHIRKLNNNANADLSHLGPYRPVAPAPRRPAASPAHLVLVN